MEKVTTPAAPKSSAPSFKRRGIKNGGLESWDSIFCVTIFPSLFNPLCESLTQIKIIICE
jgi:hypothetical protein